MQDWLAQVFSYPDLFTVLAIMGKTLVVYVGVIAGLRLIGNRELGQMTTYDFVLIVVIANAVQNALTGGDTTLVGGLASALSLLLANVGLTWLLTNFSWLESKMVGEPAVLVTGGNVMWDRMKREGVTRDELLAGLREHGIAAVDDVDLAVLEVDGTISVVPKDAQVKRTRHRIRGLKTT